MEQKKVYSCDYAQQSLFLCYNLLSIVLFSIGTTVYFLLPHPVLFDLSLPLFPSAPADILKMALGIKYCHTWLFKFVFCKGKTLTL